MILCRRNGMLHHAPSSGPALGIVPDAHFDQQTLLVEPGDTVLVYSDGVTEALDRDGNEFGEAGVERLVLAHRTESATTICQRLVAAVRQHAGGMPLVDDVTVLCLRRHLGD
ncbi:MAG: serine/threonine-protein phosphatase [Gemmatimonadetes bacterium]|nr:serine/threonine-protein phosphatase [Gemmatimonadota bacterium]